MNRGYIKIKETSHQKFIVEAQLVDGNLWITKHEMADLFNVPVSMVGNNLSAIFKSGISNKEDVTSVHSFERNGKPFGMTLYNLEALIFVSYRIASFEARAFRRWVMNALCEYTRDDKNIRTGEVFIIYNAGENLSSIITLN
jgi:hypothetical protein